MAARRTGIPFVTTYHGIYNASNPIKRFYNSVMVKSDAVIANSQWTADHIAREHRHFARADHRNPSWRRSGGIRSRRRFAGPRRRMTCPMGHRGREIDPAPGPADALEGTTGFHRGTGATCRRELIGKVKAVIAGDPQGRDGLRRRIRAAISRSRLQDVVQIVPHVTDMPAAYLASDIVVSASTDPEAFGRVAAEASAMGRPVIATDHGGARETVLAGRSGLLISPNNTERAYSCTECDALGQRRGASPDGEAGRAHVRANFSLDRMCTGTIAVYRRLLSRAGNV